MNQETLSPLWTHLTSEGNMTGTWRAALPVYQDQPSPCLGACPVNGKIAAWIGHVADGELRKAWEVLCDNNPFPAIAGRICHHPCETACNRVQLDETVGICSLERHVGDVALAEGWSYTPGPDCGVSVAVIGGGPAGLSAAYQLRRAGIAVTLYEGQAELGGLMRFGIPSYRLSRAVLEGEIARIVKMGVDLRLRAEVPDIEVLESLAADFDAVFLATGASLPKRLPGLDYSAGFVVESARFLAAPEADQRAMTGNDILVIGGGSAAMDVARTGRRLGRKVTVMTLEQEGHLPAQQVELDEAREEGVEFVTGAMLQQTELDRKTVTIRAVRVDFEHGPARGQFDITPVENSDFSLRANTIIPAIGQDADLGRWAGLVKPIGPVLEPHAGQIWTGGDVASMDRFVTQAIGMGKEAAREIIAELLPDAPLPVHMPGPEVDYGRINAAYHAEHGRTRQAGAPPAERLQSFAEVQQPLTHDQAKREAERCFSCGTCIHCDNCYLYCPDMAINRLFPGYEVKTDYCKGCGLCVEECPTGSIHMQEDAP